jgi:hypothetical protein
MLGLERWGTSVCLGRHRRPPRMSRRCAIPRIAARDFSFGKLSGSWSKKGR